MHGARLAPGMLAELGWRWRHGPDVVIKVQNERMQARRPTRLHPSSMPTCMLGHAAVLPSLFSRSVQPSHVGFWLYCCASCGLHCTCAVCQPAAVMALACEWERDYVHTIYT